MMQFILEQQAQLVEKQTQTEQALVRVVATVDKLADQVTKLDEVMETLAKAQIQNQERFRQSDERLDRLVSAMGELIARLPNNPN